VNRRLRLIHSGRLLTDGSLLYPWLLSLEERQRQTSADEDQSSKELSGATVWLHCSVGPVMEDGEDDDRGTAQVGSTKS
jgi:DSC E3 ubiquitin ligase complex subunit 3, ubiquitin-like domain